MLQESGVSSWSCGVCSWSCGGQGVSQGERVGDRVEARCKDTARVEARDRGASSAVMRLKGNRHAGLQYQGQ